MKKKSETLSAEELHKQASVLNKQASAANDNGDYKKAAELFKRALELFEKAGKQGDLEAQYIVSIMYSEGRGTPADYTAAAKWSRMAAEGGSDYAQYSLGIAYFQGAGVTQNFVRSHMWLSLAARTGYDRPNDWLPLVLARMTRSQIAEAKKLAIKMGRKIPVTITPCQA